MDFSLESGFRSWNSWLFTVYDTADAGMAGPSPGPRVRSRSPRSRRLMTTREVTGGQDAIGVAQTSLQQSPLASPGPWQDLDEVADIDADDTNRLAASFHGQLDALAVLRYSVGADAIVQRITKNGNK